MLSTSRQHHSWSCNNSFVLPNDPFSATLSKGVTENGLLGPIFGHCRQNPHKKLDGDCQSSIGIAESRVQMLDIAPAIPEKGPRTAISTPKQGERKISDELWIRTARWTERHVA